MKSEREGVLKGLLRVRPGENLNSFQGRGGASGGD